MKISLASVSDSDPSNSWKEVFSVNSPEANRLTVSNLRPHTRYRLRLVAENIKGRSPASLPTEWFWTQEAAPDAAPQGLLMRVTGDDTIQARWRVSLRFLRQILAFEEVLLMSHRCVPL